MDTLDHKKWWECRVDLANKIKHEIPLLNNMFQTIDIIKQAINAGNMLYIFGNGGSAAQAQHFAAELVVRFQKNRRALPAIALTTDTSVLTASGNDLGFETIFSRQIEALVKCDDVLIGITTSDVSDTHSINISNAFIKGWSLGTKNIGLFSDKTKNLLPITDVSLIVPATDTAIIQEAHLTLIHFICREVELAYV